MKWQRLSQNPWQGFYRFLSLFCISYFLLVTCTYRPAQQTDGTWLRLGTTLQLRTIDPADAYDLASSILLYNLSDRLYTYELGTTTLKPQLAEALPTISEDGLTYTIPLRRGVQFHDGTPFNAEAMAFSLNRVIQNQGQPSFLLADTIKSVNATKEFELTIQLQKPFAAFPALLTFFGTCAVSPQHYEIGTGKFKPDTFVGTGPYQLIDYGTDRLKLKAFAEYWGEKPGNSGIELQRFSSAANLYNAFVTSAVDVAYQSLDPSQIESLQTGATQGKWQAIASASNGVSFWVLNTKNPALQSPQVRQAIAATIDRPLIIERALQGQAEPIYSLMPTSFEGYQPVLKTRYGDGNATQAQQLLQAAGYSSTNPLELEVWYPSHSLVRGRVASALSAIATEKLNGILKLEPKSVEFATATANLDKGIYQTFLLDWFPDFFDADNYIQPFLSCAKGSATTECESGGSQSQGSFYWSDRINQLIEQQRQELDPQKRQILLQEIQEIFAADVPYIPLWQATDYAFAQNNVSGVRLDPTQQLPFTTMTKAVNNTRR